MYSLATMVRNGRFSTRAAVRCISKPSTILPLRLHKTQPTKFFSVLSVQSDLKQKESSPEPVKCYHCGKTGHLSGQCRNRDAITHQNAMGKNADYDIEPLLNVRFDFALGAFVEEAVTKTIGIITCRMDSLTGCTRYAISPPNDVDGKPRDTIVVDGVLIRLIRGDNLIHVGQKQQKRPAAERGGPTIRIKTQKILADN